MVEEQTLGKRLGQSVHVSLLRRKIRRLMRGPFLLEDWLLDLANSRGVRSVSRISDGLKQEWETPGLAEFSNEELVVAICQPQNLDRPQWLRAAAEIISSERVNFEALVFLAKRERCSRILAELARQALVAEPDHKLWRRILEDFGDAKPLRDSLIHWSRLTSNRAGADSRNSRRPDRPLAR